MKKIEISIKKYYQSSLDELDLLPEQFEFLNKIQEEYPYLKVKTVDDVLSTNVNYFQASINESDEFKRFEKEDYVRQNFSRPFLQLKIRLGFDKWLPQALQNACSEIMANHQNDFKTGKLYLVFEPNNSSSEQLMDLLPIDNSIGNDESTDTDDKDDVDEDCYEETPLSIFDLSEYKFIKKINDNLDIKELLKIDDDSTIRDLFDIDESEVKKIKSIGDTYVVNLTQLKKDFQEKKVKLNPISQSKIQPRISFEKIDNVTIESVDNIIFEDVDIYLHDVIKNKRDVDIATSRWGYGGKQETLEVIGERYKITRERVRQRAKRINQNLLTNLRIFPDTLWQIISDNLTEELTDLLPSLFSLFDKEKDFYEFLDLCCGKKIGTIKNVLSVGEQSREAINSLFCECESPISQDTLNDKLIEEYGYTRESAINEIRRLQSEGKIEITEDGIYPRKLGKKEAIAHVLTFFPDGLPWLDVARVINKKGFSKTIFPERLVDQFHNNNNVYLCERGTFRHIKFIEFDMENKEKIILFMNMIRNYLTDNGINNVALRLDDFYSENHPDIDYYILRYLVREYGEDFGIFFYGRSGVDSISLKSFNDEIRRISLVDRLVKILKESSTPMTKQQLALNLNKNTNHVAYLMDKLAENSEEIKIVRVDSMRFTTPEKAFSNIDVERVINVIKKIVEESNIVEAEVFKEKVNQEFNYSYDKNFYSSLIKKYLSELKWYRGGYLFSREPLPYDSMTDACRQLCKTELKNPENENLIKEHILLTKDVATNAVAQWRTLTNQRNVTI